MDSDIRKDKEIGPLMVSRIYAGEFDKEGTITAEIKQTITITSYYPSKSVSNSLQSNIFSIDEFGFEEQTYTNSEVRVAWIAVPQESTKESVENRLKTFEKANIYKILSNHPILTDEDEYAIAEPSIELTKDKIAEKQAVRYGPDHERAGELIFDINGKIQYRRTAFAKNGEKDIDKRTANLEDVYLSDVLKAEINNVFHIIEDQAL